MYNRNVFPSLKELSLQKECDKTESTTATGHLEIHERAQKVKQVPDLNGLQPRLQVLGAGISIEGAPVIYEYPIPNAPRGLYKIGYDPVRQDDGTSLAAIIVYKGIMQGSYTKNCIVAEYIGRKETNDDIHYIAELFAELYNTQIMYENEVPDLKKHTFKEESFSFTCTST